MDRGGWWATVHGAAKELNTTEHTHTKTGILPVTREGASLPQHLRRVVLEIM